MIQITIGLNTEGKTDVRFLKSIVKRTFEGIAFDCRTDIEILDIVTVKAPKGGFTQAMLEASREGVTQYGINILCIHADADSPDSKAVWNHKFVPFLKRLSEMDDKAYCKTVVPVIPVQMTEAWMLADKDLLRRILNAGNRTDQDLGIGKAPEAYADPKDRIAEALRIAQEGVSRRRYQVKINDLYGEIGRDIELDALRKLPSFNRFEQEVRSAFQEMNYL